MSVDHRSAHHHLELEFQWLYWDCLSRFVIAGLQVLVLDLEWLLGDRLWFSPSGFSLSGIDCMVSGIVLCGPVILLFDGLLFWIMSLGMLGFSVSSRELCKLFRSRLMWACSS